MIDGATAMTGNNTGSNISHLVGHVEAFKMKLRLFATCLKINDLSNIDSLHELLADNVEVECSRFVEDIEALSHEFENRYKDFGRLNLIYICITILLMLMSTHNYQNFSLNSVSFILTYSCFQEKRNLREILEISQQI